MNTEDPIQGPYKVITANDQSAFRVTGPGVEGDWHDFESKASDEAKHLNAAWVEGQRSGWVKAEERLPDEHRRSMLVYCADLQNKYTAYVQPSEKGETISWFHFDSGDPVTERVTHWMPLPQPPNP